MTSGTIGESLPREREDGERCLKAETLFKLFEVALIQASSKSFGLVSPSSAADELKGLFARLEVDSVSIRGPGDPSKLEVPRQRAASNECLRFCLQRRLPFVLDGAREFRIDLNNQQLGAGSLTFLLEQLLDAPEADRVREMDLTANGGFTRELSEKLGAFLRSPSCKLRRLALCHCGLDDALLGPVVSALKENETLTELLLGYNKITDASKPVLEDLAGTHPSLSAMSLGWDSRGDYDKLLSLKTDRGVQKALADKLESRRRSAREPMGTSASS